jgi:hypothetical protein
MMNADDGFVIERRRSPRLKVTSAARIRPNNWSTTQVDILDVSEHGFRASGEVSFRIGSLVSLRIPGLGWVDARIVWQHLQQFGARFDVPIDLGECAWIIEARRGAPSGRQVPRLTMPDERQRQSH